MKPNLIRFLTFAAGMASCDCALPHTVAWTRGSPTQSSYIMPLAGTSHGPGTTTADNLTRIQTSKTADISATRHIAAAVTGCHHSIAANFAYQSANDATGAASSGYLTDTAAGPAVCH